MTDSKQSGFEFVMQDPTERFSNETRTKIRKQAMRGRVSAPRHGSSRSSSSPTTQSKCLTRCDSDLEHPLPPMPLSGLELLVRDRGLDPMDLSALASIHIGTMLVPILAFLISFAYHRLNRAAIVLSSEPSPLPGVLLCRQRSYFSYIPSHFGHTLALDDAFRCLITSAHSKLVPTHSSRPETILSNYSNALHSLQSAVKNPETRYSTEVLCATAVLSIFEVSIRASHMLNHPLTDCKLLNSPNGMPWSQHIAGASRLIQLRGPSRFTSEFDKSLFISLSYPIVSIALPFLYDTDTKSHS
jgi:hypothetical protein